MNQNKVHLVLSSGGIKCLSYIGAIKKMQEENIIIESVSACSMGTIIGALFCSGLSISEIEKATLKFDFKQIKKKKPFYFLKFLSYPYASHYYPDINQKQFLVYSSETHPDMKISEVLKIATAIPFLFEPYEYDNRLLVDAALASETPIWMAANNPGFYPIIVLKPTRLPDYSFTKQFGLNKFIGYLFQASISSHDSYINLQTTRAIEIAINCEEMAIDNFAIKPIQINNLYLEGEKAVEQKLKEFNHNFNNILQIEEIKSPNHEGNLANKAASLATQMMSSYQNEVIKRNLAFVSYSRDDKNWLYKLQTQLKPIEKYRGIKAWDDTEIKPGQEWDKEIENALVATKVAIFLVTPNFLASDFINEREMKYFLDISEKQNVPILWIAVSHSNYEQTPLKNIQCANNPEMPLDTLSDADLNLELTKISKAIIDLMN
jgi:predicted acylesterase/phospholipase RssA